jgi:hypothetical protein
LNCSKLVVIIYSMCLTGAVKAVSPDIRQQLEESALFWEDYGEVCDGWSFPSKREEDGRCDDGDALLFNGLLCMASYSPACKAAREALDSNGQWWRSPRQVGGLHRTKNSFSRDMSLGALLYLVKTSDQDAALKWIEWIQNNRSPLEIRPGLRIGKVSRLCHDEEDFTCLMSPAVWQNMGRAWKAIGLPPTSRMSEPYKEFGDLGMRLNDLSGKLGYEWTDLAILELKSTKPGYAMHLKGVLVYLVQKINEKAGLDLYNWRPLALELTRRQPKNLFFRFLAEGPSDALASELLSSCPNPNTIAPKRQWAWERADADEAWKKSMGWDCLFMSYLLLGKDHWPIDTSSRPAIPEGKRRTITDVTFGANLYEVHTVAKREERLVSACELAVSRAVSTTKEVTGLNLTFKNVFPVNLYGVTVSEQALGGKVTCEYELDYGL